MTSNGSVGNQSQPANYTLLWVFFIHSLRAEVFSKSGESKCVVSQARGQIRPAFLHHVPIYYSCFSTDTWDNLISVLLVVWGFLSQIFQGVNSLKSWRSSPSQALFLISVMFRSLHWVVIPLLEQVAVASPVKSQFYFAPGQNSV